MVTMSKTVRGKELASSTEFNSVPLIIKKEIQEFINSIAEINFLCPDGNPNLEWGLFERSTQQEAYDAAWIVAYGATADTVSKWEDTTSWAAYAAVRKALSGVSYVDAVEDIVSKAASDKQPKAATSAALYALYILAKDLDFPGKERYSAHVNEHWNVWEKGYGLAAEVNGKFYVYTAKPVRTEESLLRR